VTIPITLKNKNKKINKGKTASKGTREGKRKVCHCLGFK
jgi:hypothetical protein